MDKTSDKKCAINSCNRKAIIRSDLGWPLFCRQCQDDVNAGRIKVA